MLEFKFWLEDNWKKLLFFSAVLILILFLLFKFFSNKSTGLPENMPASLTKEESTYMDTKSEALKEVFSELNTTDVSTDDSYAIYEIALYLKQPTISESELRQALTNYVTLEIMKLNGSKYIKGIKFKIYDRKLVYDKDLTPRGEGYYMLKSGETLEKISKNKKLKEEYEPNGNENRNDVVWNMTVGEKGNPNYDDYKVTLVNFTQMDEKKAQDLLSDEEFAFYLKMQMYSKITGTDIAGARLYLRWDLGRDLSESGLSIILKDFKSFNEREKGTGVRIDYYDNEYLLKQDLAVYRPQFLLFAEYGIMETDYSKAQKLLIKKNADLYKQVIENEINEQVNNLDDDGEQKEEDTETLKKLEEKYGSTTGNDKYTSSSGLRSKGSTIGDKNSEKSTKEEIDEYKKANNVETTDSSSEEDYVDLDKDKTNDSSK